MSAIDPAMQALTRRSFLAATGAAFGAALSGVPALASGAERTLFLSNPNTNETFEAVYWADGAPREPALEDLHHFLRDWRRDETIRIDTRVLDIAWQIQQKLGADEPLSVISAYRSPATNAALRRRSKGVAKNSYHCRGMAIDIRHPKIKASTVRKAARLADAGGIGYYPRSNFVHVDCGPAREWRG